MKHTRNGVKLLGAGAILAFALAGCASPSSPVIDAETPADTTTTSETAATGTPIATSPTKAIAVLYPTKGSDVKGTVTFTKVDEGLRIEADLSGLTPGEHGFHVHENGDCTANDGSSAGGHFNPEDMNHGAPGTTPRHVGDFGNITADADGNAHYERVDSEATLSGDDSVIGRAVIVHAHADDLTSQPSGDAGSREACGVVGVIK